MAKNGNMQYFKVNTIILAWVGINVRQSHAANVQKIR